MKKFEYPEIEVIAFSVEDVITTSVEDNGGYVPAENEGGIDW